MPWSAADAKKYKKGLSPKQARQWARVANSVLRRCRAAGGTQARCEGAAIRQANGVVGAPAQHERRITINTALTVPPTRMTLNAQEYLTAPAVIVVEGVLNGGYIPGDELHPQDWNGVAVTVGHPTDGQGIPHSARQPTVIATCGLGQLYHVRRSTGTRQGQSVASLQGELWIHLGNAQRCGPEGAQVISMLEAQQPLEVSTAFYSQAEAVTGTFHGVPYAEIHRQLRPDHLALLPNAVGACSWADGCGSPRLNHSDMTYTCACAGPTCTCDESEAPMTETQARGWRGFVQVLREFVSRDDGEPAPVPAPPRPQDPDDLPPDEDDDDDDDEPRMPEEDAEVAALAAHRTDTDIRESLYGCLARERGMDATPIFIEGVNSTEQTFTYRQGERLCQRSWTDEEGLIQLIDDERDVQRETLYTPVPVTEAEEEPMPTMTPHALKARVNALIANAQSGWTERDRPMLEAMNEATLIRLEHQPTMPPPVVAPEPHEPADVNEAINDMPEKLQPYFRAAVRGHDRAMNEVIERIKLHKRNPFSEDELRAMEIERLLDIEAFGGGAVPTLQGESYGGRRMPPLRVVTTDEDPAPPAPPDLALVVQEQIRLGLRSA